MADLELPLDWKKKNKEWIEVAKPGFRHPARLWGEYRQRYNTITIPLLDEDDYFADAIAAARRAENREHLEELLAEKSEERRRNLEDLTSQIALASIYHRNRFRSSTAKKFASQVSREKSLHSFLQFVCDAVFDWADADDGDDPSRTDKEHERDVSAGSRRRGDGQPDDGTSDLSGVGYDEYAYENHQGLSPDPMEFWDLDEDEAWNDASWKVKECHDGGAEPEERVLPATSRQRISLMEAGGVTDDQTQPDVEAPHTVPDHPVDDSERVPNASSETHSLTHDCSAPSHPTNDSLTNCVPPAVSDSTAAAGDAKPSQIAQASVPQQTLGTSDDHETDKVSPPTTAELPAACDGEPGACRESESGGNTGIGRKRARDDEGHDQCDDAGLGRQKRRATGGEYGSTGEG